MEVITEKTRKAIKEHSCDWCLENILKGEKYNIQTNVSEGVMYSWKSHTRCTELVRQLSMEDDGEGIGSDDFMEYIIEYLNKNLTEEEFEKVNNEDGEIEKACELLKIGE